MEKIEKLNNELPEFFLDDLEDRLETDPLSLCGMSQSMNEFCFVNRNPDYEGFCFFNIHGVTGACVFNFCSVDSDCQNWDDDNRGEVSEDSDPDPDPETTEQQ